MRARAHRSAMVGQCRYPGRLSDSLTPTSLVVYFNKVKPLNTDGSVPLDPLAKRTRITLLAGDTTPLVEDNV